MKLSRRLWPLAALAMIAVIGTGCSNDAGESSDTGTSTVSASKTKDTKREKTMRFAECMRDNGVKQFPDPEASGEMTVDRVLNGSSLDPESPAWEKAIRACKELQPSGFTGRKRTAKEQKPALQFAQCIRESGVKDFPDPEPDAPLVDTRLIPSTDQPGGMDILNAAMKKCGELAEQAMAGR